MNNVKILDVTLRDGSYAVDFAFTQQDTAMICAGLEQAGIKYIEVGHGVGLGASGERYGRAAASDEEYMQTARDALSTAKYGMFCIPGIASLDSLDLAKKYGMDFVRIGTNVTEVAQSEPYIKKAKRNGLFVAANYMKSYALKPAQFAEQVLLSEKYGADMVYIVDSAGSMFAEDIAQYYAAIRKVSEIPVGFHGHDNLGMAVANSLAAADIGIEFIDCSLQGLGRSAGNACTETYVAALLKKGYDLEIDVFRLFDAGQQFVRPLLSDKGRSPVDIVCGLSEFHSSYMPHIQRCAAKYGVDPLLLIMEITKVSKVDLDPDVLDAIGKKLPKNDRSYSAKYGLSKYVGGEQDEKR